MKKDKYKKYRRFCSQCGLPMNFVILNGNAFDYWSIADNGPMYVKDGVYYKPFDEITGKRNEFIEYKCPQQEMKLGFCRRGINSHDFYSVSKDI